MLQQQHYEDAMHELRYQLALEKSSHSASLAKCQTQQREYLNAIAEQKKETARLKTELGGRDHTIGMYAKVTEEHCEEYNVVKREREKEAERMRELEEQRERVLCEVEEMRERISRFENEMEGLKVEYQSKIEEKEAEIQVLREAEASLQRDVGILKWQLDGEVESLPSSISRGTTPEGKVE